MDIPVRLAVSEATRQRLKQIAGQTGETMYAVVERLAHAEQVRLRGELAPVPVRETPMRGARAL